METNILTFRLLRIWNSLAFMKSLHYGSFMYFL